MNYYETAATFYVCLAAIAFAFWMQSFWAGVFVLAIGLFIHVWIDWDS